MALPNYKPAASTSPPLSPRAGSKRKRDWGDEDYVGDSVFLNDSADIADRYYDVDYDGDDDGVSEILSDLTELSTDDEEDGGPRHNYTEAEEDFPAHAIYDTDLAGISEQLAGLPPKLLEALQDQSCNSKQLDGHIQRARELLTVPSTDPIRVAVLGDAGTGKSSLLNSLTDIPGLAYSISGGESCTCVPTEFRSAFPKQENAFGACIEYFQIERIRRQLKDMIRDYNTYAFEEDKDWDNDERTSFRKNHDNALDMLRTLFNDRATFASYDAATKCLERNYKERNPGLLEELAEDCEHKLKDNLSEHGYSEFRTANTMQRLRNQMDPLTTANPKLDKPSLWPLIRKVVIGVRDSRVLQRLTLVDLPGISDTNQTRVELTHEYLKSCDYVWVVAAISRVVDDGTVNDLLSRYGKVYKGKICVIVTHTDDGILGEERMTANYLHGRGYDIEPWKQFHEEAKEKDKAATQVRKQLKAAKKRKKNTKAQLIEIRQMGEEHTKMKKEVESLKQKGFAYLVATRSTQVTDRLMERFQKTLPEGQDLKVLCCSNKHYLALKGSSLFGPRLQPSETGILDIRYYALELAAPELMRTFVHYQACSIPLLLKDLGLWLNAARVNGRNELLLMVKGPQEHLHEKIVLRIENFAKEISENISNVLQQSQADAMESAVSILAKKRNKHHSSIRAFIRKDGRHSTKMCPKECWNEEMTEHFTQLLDQRWPGLEQQKQSLTDVLEGSIIADLTEVMEKLAAWPSENVPVERLREVISLHIQRVRKTFVDTAKVYEKRLRNARLDATDDSEKNHFSKTTKPVYEACVEDRGPGVTQRSMDNLIAHVSKCGTSSPFVVMERELTSALLKIEEIWTSGFLEQKVASILAQVYQCVEELVQDAETEGDNVKGPQQAVADVLPALNEEYAELCERFEALREGYEESEDGEGGS